MTFFDFILDFWDNIPNDNFDNLSIITSSDKDIKETFKNEPDMVCFNSNDEMIKYLSPKLADYCYENESVIEDLPSTLNNFPESLFLYNDIPEEWDHVGLKHVCLDQIGIIKFAVRGNAKIINRLSEFSEENVLIIRYSKIPIFERMLIDNYIWNMCIDEIIRILKNRTMFNIEKCYIEGGVGYVIKSSSKISQLNNIHQLKMYVERFFYGELQLLRNLVKNKITIESSYINMPYEELPHFVDFNVFLEKCRLEDLPVTYENEDLYKLEKVKFQVVVNPDKSVSLIPYPLDVERIISIQANMWRKYNEDYGYDSELVPNEIIHLFEYIRDNHLTLSYGFGKFLITKIKKNKEKNSKYSIVYLKEIKD